MRSSKWGTSHHRKIGCSERGKFLQQNGTPSGRNPTMEGFSLRRMTEKGP